MKWFSIIKDEDEVAPFERYVRLMDQWMGREEPEHPRITTTYENVLEALNNLRGMPRMYRPEGLEEEIEHEMQEIFAADRNITGAGEELTNDELNEFLEPWFQAIEALGLQLRPRVLARQQRFLERLRAGHEAQDPHPPPQDFIMQAGERARRRLANLGRQGVERPTLFNDIDEAPEVADNVVGFNVHRRNVMGVLAFFERSRAITQEQILELRHMILNGQADQNLYNQIRNTWVAALREI